MKSMKPSSIWRFIMVTALLFVMFLGCGQNEEGPKAIALVAGEEISDADVRLEVAKLPGVPEDYEQAATAALNNLVDEALLIAEAQKRNLTVSDEEVEQRLNALANDYPIGGLDDYLAEHDIDQAVLRERIKRTLLAASALEALLSEYSTITDEEINNYYQGHEAEFSKQETVALRRITVGSGEEAELVKQKMEYGQDFTAIARENSIDSEAAQGGNLGEVELGKLPAEVQEIVLNLTPGVVSEPIISSNGKRYTFYMLEERKPSRQLTLEEVTPIIKDKLSRKRSQTVYPEIISNLKEEYDVQIDWDSIPTAPATEEE